MFPWHMPLVNPPYRTLPPPSASSGRAVSVRRALQLIENTATERSNVAFFCLSAADAYSGQSESLFLVILDIFNRESRLSSLRMDPRRLLAGMTEADGPSRHFLSGIYLCPVTTKMDPRSRLAGMTKE